MWSILGLADPPFHVPELHAQTHPSTENFCWKLDRVYTPGVISQPPPLPTVGRAPIYFKIQRSPGGQFSTGLYFLHISTKILALGSVVSSFNFLEKLKELFVSYGHETIGKNNGKYNLLKQ